LLTIAHKETHGRLPRKSHKPSLLDIKPPHAFKNYPVKHHPVLI